MKFPPHRTTAIRFSYVFVFLLSFLAVTFLNLPYLHMPPVWDAAAGVFAPAIYLYENNFDFLELVQQSGYLHGSPNVHSFSLTTILTYAVIALTNGDPAFYLPVLHVINFFFAALVMTATFALARQQMGIFAASLIAIALLIFPLFWVQSSYLYTEVSGAALVVLAMASWSSRRLGWMLLFTVLACLVKSFGMALTGSLIIVMVLDKTMTLAKRLLWCLLLGGITAGIEITKWSVAVSQTSKRIDYLEYLRSLLDYLLQVPDLYWLVILSCAFPLIFFTRRKISTPKLAYKEISRLIQGDVVARNWVAITIFPIMFMGFIATVPYSGISFIPLPRYYVWSLPLMLLMAGYSVLELPSLVFVSQRIPSQAAKKRIGYLMLIIGIILLGLNHKGSFYPQAGTPFSAFSIAERSFEYLDFFNVQRAGVKSLEKHNEGRPVFVTRGEIYFLSSPLMGYIDQQAPDSRFVLDPPYSSGKLSDFPSDFLILDAHSNNYHGQHVVYQVLKQAVSHKDYIVNLVSQHASGAYRSTVFRIYSINKDSSK